MELSLATANTNMTNKVNFNNMLLSQFIDYLDNVQKITAKNYNYLIQITNDEDKCSILLPILISYPLRNNSI